jgi:tripartite-type tricarboxylate transporter receptor subunit TctC
MQGAAAAPLAGSSFATASFADDYPDREIHAISMFGPGSGADTSVRYFADKLANLAGKPVIVDSKPGAFGNIATSYVARAKPDGYTIYIAPGSSVLASAPSLFRSLSYDPLKDFEHITTLYRVSFLQVVGRDSPHRSVADLTKVLRGKGDKGSYGSVANTGLVASEIYKQSLGLATVEVKYKDTQALVIDLASGALDFAHIDFGSVQAQLQDGTVRPLATSSVSRIKALPGVPGSLEAGIPNLDIVAWWSVHVPKGTPKPICDQLESWFNRLVSQPEVEKWLESLGREPFPGNSRTVKELMAKEIKAWADYVKLAKIVPLG